MTRIQRHFRPLTLRARFSPERLLTPSPSTLRTTFPCMATPSDVPQFQAAGSQRTLRSLIKKPIGEVSKNYKLFDVAALDGDTYKAIEVRVFHLRL